MYVFLTVLLVLFVHCIFISAHPQCLDTDPPFKLKGSDDVFCQKYKTFGCCNHEKNSEIQMQYQNIIKILNAKGKSGCDSFTKEILCQTCSPYAAHVFEIKLEFPELCSDYCSQLYDKCKDVIPYVTGDQEILNYLGSKVSFCDFVTHGDTIYCWPNIIDNTDLTRAIDRQTESKVGCLCLKEFATGLKNPMRFRSPNDGTGRIFILEQIGIIWIYSKDGVKVSKPFLDISKDIKVRNNRGNENGLIGFEFHPQYKSNHKFYIHYTVSSTDSSVDARSIISEIQTKVRNINKADLSTERIILQIDQPNSIHNAGELLFGIDGYLYIFLGDGGPSNDKYNNGQNRTTFLGSILRLDVSNPEVPYRNPRDNPFAGFPDAESEIYAYGVRNPWRGDVDEGDPETGYGRGRMIFGDVGQARYEEIDVLQRGGNYGWRPKEGNHCSYYFGINPKECNKIKKDISPIKEFNHNFGNAIVPGHVYRGCYNPALNGLYIFGFHFHQTYGGRIFSLNETAENSNKWESKEINLCGDDVCYNGWTNVYGRYLMGFGEDDDGEIYLMSSNTAIITDASGAVFRLVDPNRRGDPASCRSKNSGNSTATTPTVVTTISATTKFTTLTTDPNENIVGLKQMTGE